MALGKLVSGLKGPRWILEVQTWPVADSQIEARLTAWACEPVAAVAKGQLRLR